jgi:hypothetical protein
MRPERMPSYMDAGLGGNSVEVVRLPQVSKWPTRVAAKRLQQQSAARFAHACVNSCEIRPDLG